MIKSQNFKHNIIWWNSKLIYKTFMIFLIKSQNLKYKIIWWNSKLIYKTFMIFLIKSQNLKQDYMMKFQINL